MTCSTVVFVVSATVAVASAELITRHKLFDHGADRRTKLNRWIAILLDAGGLCD